MLWALFALLSWVLLLCWLNDTKYDAWPELINCADEVEHILLCENWNAHSEMLGSKWKDVLGKELSFAVCDRNLALLNNQEPAFLPMPGQTGPNLDLVILSTSLVHLASVEVSDNTYKSDHFLVKGIINATPMMSSSSSRRFRIFV